ncbi:hypothetical protein H8F21_13470 [Pseudomonas sp. P66]|uniref:Uncharacterized protein n=1 Tax=Pseudomonas arcuscaelestis TaxID=2710591 RepID=A0ABS2BZT6_9PSED|nr:hypothetical protein [Pseudomonas arcuscaelestis]MBM5458573.1 hypothetical protein [Pseudomonas arcuscaelestis]
MAFELKRFLEFTGTVAGIAGAVLLSLNVSYSPYGYVLFLFSSLLLAGHARIIRARWLLMLQACFLITIMNGIYHWLLLPVMGGQ